MERVNWDIYDDFKFKKQLWSPWFIQKYFSVVRVNLLYFHSLLAMCTLFMTVMILHLKYATQLGYFYWKLNLLKLCLGNKKSYNLGNCTAWTHKLCNLYFFVVFVQESLGALLLACTGVTCVLASEQDSGYVPGFVGLAMAYCFMVRWLHLHHVYAPHGICWINIIDYKIVQSIAIIALWANQLLFEKKVHFFQLYTSVGWLARCSIDIATQLGAVGRTLHNTKTIPQEDCPFRGEVKVTLLVWFLLVLRILNLF